MLGQSPQSVEDHWAKAADVETWYLRTFEAKRNIWVCDIKWYHILGLKPIFVDNTMSFLDLSLWSSRSLRNERRPKRSRRSRVQVEILIEVATRGLTADPLLGSDVVSTLVDSFCCGIHLDSEFSTHPSASIHIHPGFIRFVVFCPHFFRGCVGTLQGRPVRWPDQPDQPDWPDWPGARCSLARLGRMKQPRMNEAQKTNSDR